VLKTTHLLHSKTFHIHACAANEMSGEFVLVKTSHAGRYSAEVT